LKTPPPPCPECGKPMEWDRKHNTYKCENPECEDQYISVPKSIFGGE